MRPYLCVVLLLALYAPATAQTLEIPDALDPSAISPELRRDSAEVNGVRLHYVTGGDGPVVLLWHGFLGNWASWRKVLPLLVEDYTVVAPDMRGYGHSSTPDSLYDARTLKDDYRALMQRLGHDRVHIIAHDMGAPPALIYAADHPDEVLTLTYLDEPVMLPSVIADLIEMTPENTHYGGLWWWMMAQSPSMTQTLVRGNERDFVAWFYDHYTAVDGAIDLTAREYFAADLADDRGIHGWFGVYRDVFETIEQTAPLADDPISTPVLALGAELSLGDRVREMLSRVATTVEGGAVEGTGHFIAEEVPEELVRRFKAFVAAHP